MKTCIKPALSLQHNNQAKNKRGRALAIAEALLFLSCSTGHASAFFRTATAFFRTAFAMLC